MLRFVSPCLPKGEKRKENWEEKENETKKSIVIHLPVVFSGVFPGLLCIHCNATLTSKTSQRDGGLLQNGIHGGKYKQGSLKLFIYLFIYLLIF